MENNSAEWKLSKAKAQLLIEHPFYASLLCNLPFVEDASVPTMAVDGVNVYYNPEFVNGLTVNQLKFVEAHEVMHCVMQHMTRLKHRDHHRWNVAGDYIINDMLVADGVGEMPEGGLHDPNIVAAGKHTTDGVYNILPETSGKGGDGSPGSHGNPLDNVLEGNSQTTDKELQETWTIRAVQAAQAAKMMGKLSAGAKRFAEQLTNHKVPWQELLRRFVSKRVKTDRSFSKPNRRFLHQGMYLPSFSGEALGEIAVAVDCSGSIGQRELNEFATEIKAIRDIMRPSKVHVLYFDSSVSHTEEYLPDDDLNIQPHGGGGTAFSPIFAKVDQLGIEPECMVVLTDLYCNDFGRAPEYPVLWVTNGAEEAPWGEVAKME